MFLTFLLQDVSVLLLHQMLRPKNRRKTGTTKTQQMFPELLVTDAHHCSSMFSTGVKNKIW